MKFLYTLLLFTVASIPSLGASRILADSCSQADVSAAITAALHGDTVIIPEGTCSWTGTETLDVSNKKLRILGSGIGKTVLDYDTGACKFWDITTAGDELFEFGNFTLHLDSGLTACQGMAGAVDINGTGTRVYVHDIHFDQDGTDYNNLMVVGPGPIFGVFSGLIFDETSGATNGCAAIMNVDAEDDLSGWTREIGWGGPNFTFIEDSEFKWSNSGMDCVGGTSIINSQRGGKFVLRYSEVEDQGFGQHGFDSGNVASTLAVEAYGNQWTWTSDVSGAIALIWRVRGGTARVHNETYDLDSGISLTRPYLITTYRSPDDINYGGGAVNSWAEACDGGAYKFCDTLDSDFTRTSTMDICDIDADCPGGGAGACKWMLCSGSFTLCTIDGDCPGSETCSNYVDGGSDPATNKYPCFNQGGRGTGNTLDPLYVWDTTITGTTSTWANGAYYEAGDTNILTENTDFFNDTAPSGYAPYPYPHPLRAGNGISGGKRVEGSHAGGGFAGGSR